MRDHSQKNDDAAIDMTPMLDVVFIMLIFFIVTAVFVKEAGRDINRPDAETGIMQPQVSILVAITDKNDIVINRKVVDLDSVRSAIKKLHAENPRGTVNIQADEGSDATLMMKVFDQIRDAGVQTIAISTEKK